MLFNLLAESASKVAWAFFSIIVAEGLGLSISAVLPAILTGLSQTDVASAVAEAEFSFTKKYGFI
jgi:hypothetical protein